MLDKSKLRKDILKKRDSLSYNKRKEFDSDIFEKLINSNLYKKAKCIFVFVSYKTEVDTHNIIRKALEDGKKVCVPKVLSKQKGMKAIEIKKFEDLKKGAYGILEPEDYDELISPKYIDLVLVPGSVFDNRGGRIGYGGGFYDKYLLNIKVNVPKIGLAYKNQIVENVPMDELDIRIDGIITNG